MLDKIEKELNGRLLIVETLLLFKVCIFWRASHLSDHEHRLLVHVDRHTRHRLASLDFAILLADGCRADLRSRSTELRILLCHLLLTHFQLGPQVLGNYVPTVQIDQGGSKLVEFLLVFGQVQVPVNLSRILLRVDRLYFRQNTVNLFGDITLVRLTPEL